MKKLKIVIISYSWPPRNAISVHRPYSWARYWSKKGHDITILTPKKQSFDFPFDLNLPNLKNVKVIELPYRIFWTPLLKFRFIDKTSRWLKKIFGKYLEPSYNPRNHWFNSTSPTFSKLARECDVVISTYGPEVSHIIGYKMKILNPSIFWIADYRDLWSDNPGLEGISKKIKLKIKTREKETVGRYADLLTSVSDNLCKRLTKLLKKPATKVSNGYDIDKNTVQKNISKKIFKFKKTLKIVFTGNIYSKEINPVMLLDSILNLVEKKKIPKNSFVLEFYGMRHDFIDELSLNPKYKDLISLKGHIPRSEVLKKQKKADILLLLLSPKEISRGVLTGKFFEYMAAGKPILCIGGKFDFDIGKILRSTKIGQIFEENDKKKLENVLVSSYYGGGLFKAYKPNKNKLLSFSRQHIAEVFLREIKKKLLLAKLNRGIKSNKKNSKIVHIITGLERGGAERFLFNLVSNNFNGKLNNIVISLMSKGYYGNLLKEKKIPVFNLNMSRGSINVSAIKKLYKILKKHKPDIIQGWMYHGNLAALLGYIMIGRKVKLSWTIRLSLEIYKRMKFTTRLVVRLGSYLSRIPDLIIYNSVRSQNQHRNIGYFTNKDFFVPNGFDTEKWKPNKKVRLYLRNKLGIPNKASVIGYVGRGDDQKDIPTLFRAFDKVCKKRPNIFLITIGRNLKKYSTKNKNIIFLGQQSNVEDLMKTFDLLCLSSKAEGFPNVIGEAMSTGIPCVTTDVGDAKDIVDKTGWISPPNNSKALANCLDSALNNSQEQLEKYGKIARKKIISNFSIDVVKNQYISLYNSTLK